MFDDQDTISLDTTDESVTCGQTSIGLRSNVLKLIGHDPEEQNMSNEEHKAAKIMLAAINKLEENFRHQIRDLENALMLWRLEAEKQFAVKHTLHNMLARCEDGKMRFAEPISVAEFERRLDVSYDTKTVLDFFGEPHHEAVIPTEGSQNVPLTKTLSSRDRLVAMIAASRRC